MIDINFYGINLEELDNGLIGSRLSDDIINYTSITSNEEFYQKALKFLKNNGFNLFNFITNEVHSNVDYKVDSNSSFCRLDKNFIQLGISLLVDNSFDKQLRVDSLNAILIHEMLHKRYTIESISELIKVNRLKYYEFEIQINEFISKIIPNELHSFVINVFEDRRIEYIGLRDFPGYVFYFNELRKYSYITHEEYYINNSIINNFAGYLQEYLILKILLPELFDSFTAVNSKILKKPEEIKCIEDINSYIDKNCNVSEKDFSVILQWKDDIINLIPENLKKGIIKQIKPKAVYEVQKELDEDSILELKKSCSKEDEDKEEAEKNCDVKQKVVIRSSSHRSFNNIELNIPEVPDVIDEKIYAEANEKSRYLQRKLNLLDSKLKKYEEEYELNEGELDETELFSVNFNRNIFKNDLEIKDYSLDIGILLDESGSMTSLITDAMSAVLSIILGIKNHKKINLLVYGHTSDVFGKLNMFKYYDNHKLRNEKRLFATHAKEGNADGYAIQFVGNELLELGKGKKILIVVSDGLPCALHYSGKEAIDHVRLEVKELESKNIKTIQICMNNIENSPDMFDHYIQYSENSSFLIDLTKIINDELIKIFNSV